MNIELEKKLKTYRLSPDEYEKIKTLLKREPQGVEWPLFSALWSEHCSYKSSKNHLKKFSFRNANTPLMDGENAGVVDLGYGEKIAFKMESHNHPSFIEPVQGAATGVGGILRDIFTMGARPILSANYLCFGEPNAERMSYLMKGVVKGISSYGNCVGVPTVTGQTNFHPKYNKNILVNALSVGYFAPGQKMALSNAAGIGNLIVYVGAKTGRDGVHGASMASASFDNDSESKKPNVQIGDPFFEKLLIEACLDVLKQDLVVAMQDMGAAGLTSSSFEMAAKGQVGFKIDLKKVPLRDQTMSAEDILLSESQERMLLICEPNKLVALQKVFTKWHLDSAVLGEVQKDKKIKLMWGPENLVEIDPDLIIEHAPRYDRPYSKWISKNKVTELPKNNVDLNNLILAALRNSKLNQFSWIHNQYDQRVGARTAKACESSVAFCRLDHSERGLAVAVGCRPDLMELDAQLGALDAVYYPAFQMALKGAVPLAITDCLNFGNPQKLEIMTEFVASVEAIAKAAESINAPVISGNVSFYNETSGENIISTPATGVVGVRDSVDEIRPDQFQMRYESIVQVEFDWVQTDTWLSAFNNKSSHFKMNDAAGDVVAQFILRCQKIDSAAKEQKINISSIKAVGLGGVGVTCLKMTTSEIGFNLSYDTSLGGAADLFKDQLYSFILTTNDFEKTKSFLKKHFSGILIDIKIIGETADKTLCFSNALSLNFMDFKKQFAEGF